MALSLQQRQQLYVQTSLVTVPNRRSSSTTRSQTPSSSTSSEPSPVSTQPSASPAPAPTSAAPKPAASHLYSSADSYLHGPAVTSKSKAAFHSSADLYAYGWLPPTPPWLG